MSGVPIRPPSGSVIAFTGLAVLTYGLISLALVLFGLVLVRQAVVMRRRAENNRRRGGAHLRGPHWRRDLEQPNQGDM